VATSPAALSDGSVVGRDNEAKRIPAAPGDVTGFQSERTGFERTGGAVGVEQDAASGAPATGYCHSSIYDGRAGLFFWTIGTMMRAKVVSRAM